MTFALTISAIAGFLGHQLRPYIRARVGRGSWFAIFNYTIGTLMLQTIIGAVLIGVGMPMKQLDKYIEVCAVVDLGVGGGTVIGHLKDPDPV